MLFRFMYIVNHFVNLHNHATLQPSKNRDTPPFFISHPSRYSDSLFVIPVKTGIQSFCLLIKHQKFNIKNW